MTRAQSIVLFTCLNVLWPGNLYQKDPINIRRPWVLELMLCSEVIMTKTIKSAYQKQGAFATHLISHLFWQVLFSIGHSFLFQVAMFWFRFWIHEIIFDSCHIWIISIQLLSILRNCLIFSIICYKHSKQLVEVKHWESRITIIGYKTW